MRLSRQRSRGDTIIEVMFAVAVFGLVAVSCMSIMNRGTAAAERSLEITLVRGQIDAQAETIRYIHEAYIDSYEKGATIDQATNPIAYEWIAMTDKSTGRGAATASEYGELAHSSAGDECPSEAPGQKPFVLNPRTAQILSTNPPMLPPDGASLPPFAQVYDDGSSLAQSYGLWIEAVPSSSSNHVGFVDFHIRACWLTVGNDLPATLGTIVRLYEPRP